jgi:hypothetical protein
MVDLNQWHHAIHQVTGEMALRFNKATAADLARWAGMLRAVATGMEAVSHRGTDLTVEPRMVCEIACDQ